MKGKKSIYILVPSVILIWGYIIYQVVSMTSDDSAETKYALPNVQTETRDTGSDNYQLLLSYDDPFLEEQKKVKVPARKRVVRKPEPPKEKKPPVQWPNIVFIGEIINEMSGKKVYIVKINGHEYLITEGDEINDLALKEAHSDSLIFAYQENKRTFYKR